MLCAALGQADQFRFRDRRNSANLVRDSAVDIAIEPHQRERVGALLRFATAQSERGNVHTHIAERRADFSDDAGHVAIARQQQRAFQRGL